MHELDFIQIETTFYNTPLHQLVFSAPTLELIPIHQLTPEFPKQCNLQRLSQNIRDHRLRRQVLNHHLSCVDPILHKVESDRDVPCLLTRREPLVG